MGCLVDTHALLWSLEDSAQLPLSARTMMLQNAGEVFFSAASVYELEYKSVLGKLPAWPKRVAALAEAAGFFALPISIDDAETAARLPVVVRDPWDRLIAAQALRGGLTVITRDEAIARLGAAVFW
ncbi:MAG: type II toxin-antitoxin system VapC family toxin [Parvularculaceae bacterium]